MFTRWKSSLIIWCCIVFQVSASHAAQPVRFHYQAKLTDSSSLPLKGSHTLFVSVFQGGLAGTADSGTNVYSETVNLNLTDGIANHSVGDGTQTSVNPLTASIFDYNGDIFLQVAVDSAANVVLPRTRLDPVPFAISSLDGEARTIVNAANTPGDASNDFIISQPGSYYFASNITGSPSKNGISIQTGKVTLDLNGFALIAGGSGIIRGIDVPLAQTDITIRNGTVRGWGGGGVHADTATVLVEKLHASDNTTATGVSAGNGSLIRDCVATHNLMGFFTAQRTQLVNCIATLNTNVGFQCANFGMVIDCNSTHNSGFGIFALGGSTVMRCNSSDNSAAGIEMSSGCLVADSTSESNGAEGIFAGSGSTIRGCVVRANKFDGIYVGSECLVIGNTCDVNDQDNTPGYAGIEAGGDQNRIEANTCTADGGGACGGILVDGVQNLIIRNSTSGNGGVSYNIVAGNRYGAIIDLTASNPTAVNGNSAATTAGTTDPWANFAH